MAGPRISGVYSLSCGDRTSIQRTNTAEDTGKSIQSMSMDSLNNVLNYKALRLLPTNLNFPLSEITLTPYMPVPESNGEEWDRLEPASALDALVELVLHGEYNGLNSEKRVKDGLELRTAAVGVFEVS